MARKIFHSFRYKYDSWRVQTIRQIGSIEGQTLLSANGWEQVKKGGDTAIENWINHEMRKGWADGKGVLGIYIHNLKDANGDQAARGRNPLDDVTVSTKNGSKVLSSVARTYDPPYSTSQYVYDHIKENIEDW